MKDSNLKIAQNDVDEALKTVEEIEQCISNSNASKEDLKKKFVTLTTKVQKLEDILKSEGIL